MMTVGELIRELSKHDPDMEIMTKYSDDSGMIYIDDVEVLTDQVIRFDPYTDPHMYETSYDDTRDDAKRVVLIIPKD